MGRDETPESKLCAACGREMQWRKAWAANWERMRFCSAGCRRHRGNSRRDQALEQAIGDLLQQRRRGATICPSEVARKLSPEAWRPLMEPVRRAARRLVARGELEILQQGRVVDPSRARGAIRLRLRP
ncbi:hypothetical protein ABI59_05385 [Acidobacteria bacterium Mor1]|nr:hypothetical protein ABI59_05385 [Acidobacteria bacterium Mor1]